MVERGNQVGTVVASEDEPIVALSPFNPAVLLLRAFPYLCVISGAALVTYCVFSLNAGYLPFLKQYDDPAFSRHMYIKHCTGLFIVGVLELIIGAYWLYFRLSRETYPKTP